MIFKVIRCGKPNVNDCIQSEGEVPNRIQAHQHRRVVEPAGAGRTRGCHSAGAPTTALTQQPQPTRNSHP